MRTLIERPTPADQRIAGASLSRFKAAISESQASEMIIELQDNGEPITIPTKALELLSDILVEMAEGRSFSMLFSKTELSTQEAANILYVSRPYLVKLLEKGNIAYYKVGSHRRILLEDLIKYQSYLKEQRKENLKFLAEQAQSLGLGY